MNIYPPQESQEMSRKVINIDCDGVCVDFVGQMLLEVLAVTGKRFDRAAVHEWDFARALKLSPGEKKRVWNRIKSPGWSYELDAVPGAIAAIRRWQAGGHTVQFVTAPVDGSPTWGHDRKRWLTKRFPGAEVIITDAKHAIPGNIFVDDSPETVKRWGERWASQNWFLMSQPHNLGAEGFARVGELSDLTSLVERGIK